MKGRPKPGKRGRPKLTKEQKEESHTREKERKRLRFKNLMDLKKAAAAEMDQKGSKRKKNALTELQGVFRCHKTTYPSTRLFCRNPNTKV